MKNRLSSLWNRRTAWAPWCLMLSFWAIKTSRIWSKLGSAHYAMPFDVNERNPLFYVDTLQTYWFAWWIEEWAWHGEPSLMFSDRINFPAGGTTSLDYSLAIVHVVLAGLIRGLVGPSAAINLVAMLGVALSLAAVFLLIRAVSGNGLLSAVLAILVVTFGLARNNCLLDPELVFIAYMAFGLLAWLRYIERGSRGWLAVAGLMVGITCFTHAYYGIALLSCLGMSLVLSFDGMTLHGVDPKALLRRTMLVLACGIGLALLLHSRNIAIMLAIDQAEALQEPLDGNWPYTVLDGALVIASVLVPAAVGRLARFPNAALWGLMFLPVAIITLGFRLCLAVPDQYLDMPLLWARENLPFLWRLTFPQRFVAPLLLGTALSYGALWRGFARVDSASAERTGRHGLVAGVVLVTVFWHSAALLPLTPDTSMDISSPQGEDPHGSAAADLDVAGLLGVPVATTSPPSDEPGPGTRSDEVLHSRIPVKYLLPKVPLKALLWPFQPVRTMPLPHIPSCIRKLAEEDDRFAILELSVSEKERGYMAYFQTFHGKAIAGFGAQTEVLGEQQNALSDLTLIRRRYRNGELEQLPDPAWLRELGVRYVVRYDVVETQGLSAPVGLQPGSAPAPIPSAGRRFDFEAVYGAARCTDGIATLYATSGR